jgi:hypothetical protein
MSLPREPFHIHVASAMSHEHQALCLAVFDAVLHLHKAGPQQQAPDVIVTSSEADRRGSGACGPFPAPSAPLAEVTKQITLKILPPMDVVVCCDADTFAAVQNSLVEAAGGSVAALRASARCLLVLHIVCGSPQRLPLLYQMLLSQLVQKAQQLEDEAAAVMEQFVRTKAIEVALLLIPSAP